MNYWIAKANPSYNRTFDELFRIEQIVGWESTIIPKTFAKDDRIVFWQSGSARRVVALGEVADPFLGHGKNGKKNFSLRNVTGLLPEGPDISLLRKIPVFENASFLKAGPAGTVYPLTAEQGAWLYRALLKTNPSVVNVWPDLVAEQVFEDVDQPALEGRPVLVSHFRRERHRGIIERKKAQFLATHGRLFCEACGFDFAAIYGEIAEGLCEVHHTKPLGAAESEVVTSLDDLAVVCSNCHRVIHRYDPLISVKQLSASLRHSR